MPSVIASINRSRAFSSIVFLQESNAVAQSSIHKKIVFLIQDWICPKNCKLSRICQASGPENVEQPEVPLLPFRKVPRFHTSFLPYECSLLAIATAPSYSQHSPDP